jgi:hypothetical protein
MAESDFSCPRIIGYGSSPSRCGPGRHIALWSDTRAPRFRRDPCARDVALDPGGTAMPRVTALLMLRSTMKTVSAPASRSFRGSLPHPTHSLCTLRVRRHRRLTQHSLPGRPATALPGPDLHRLIAPAWPGAFLHSITSSARASSVGGTSRPSELAVFKLMTSSTFVTCCTGRSAGCSPFRMRPV